MVNNPLRCGGPRIKLILPHPFSVHPNESWDPVFPTCQLSAVGVSEETVANPQSYKYERREQGHWVPTFVGMHGAKGGVFHIKYHTKTCQYQK